MDQTVNAGQDLGKSTEGHKLYDLDLGSITYIIGCCELDPGILIGILVTEGDFFLFLVEADYIDINLVADIKYLGGVLYAAPAHFGDVNHAIDAADIDKCAIAGHGLDDTVILLADLHLIPNCLCPFAALLLSDGTDGTDYALAAAVDLCDLNANFLFEKLIHIRFLWQT